MSTFTGCFKLLIAPRPFALASHLFTLERAEKYDAQATVNPLSSWRDITTEDLFLWILPCGTDFLGPQTLARSVEHDQYYQHSGHVEGFNFAEVRLNIDGVYLDPYIPFDTFGAFLFTRENLPDTPLWNRLRD